MQPMSFLQEESDYDEYSVTSNYVYSHGEHTNFKLILNGK